MKKLPPFFLAVLITALFGCNSSPTSSFTYNEEDNGVVIFHDSCQNAKTYQWDFGDGTYALSSNPLHKFEKNGKYNVKLTAYKDNLSASSISTIEVTTVPKALVTFFTSDNSELPIQLFVDGVMIGNLNESLQGHKAGDACPENYSRGCITFSATPGIHTISAIGSTGGKWKEIQYEWVIGKSKCYMYDK